MSTSTAAMSRGAHQSYEGRHLRLEDARVFDLPDEPPLIAAELGDGLFTTEPKTEPVAAYRGGGVGPCYAEVPVAWAIDEPRPRGAVRRFADARS